MQAESPDLSGPIRVGGDLLQPAFGAIPGFPPSSRRL